jgi:hypothetical protein
LGLLVKFVCNVVVRCPLGPGSALNFELVGVFGLLVTDLSGHDWELLTQL